MLPLDTVLTFFVTALMLALAPGPDIIFVLTQSALYGMRAGVATTLGLISGLCFHTTIVAVGVAGIFMTSPLAFTLLTVVGAAYLLYLAWLSFRAGASMAHLQESRFLGYWGLYRRGVIMNITNPKVTLFFLAFLPQFCAPERGSVALQAFDAPVVINPDGSVVLNTASAEYQEAGNWVGILFAVQAVGSVLWSMAIPLFKNIKHAYSVSLILGGLGFISIKMMSDPFMLFASYFFIGCAWAGMLAIPFTLLTNALKGGNMGTYLGLFNCTICVPQIVAAATGGFILHLLSTEGEPPAEVNMLVLAGVLLIIGAVCAVIIKTGTEEKA